jgi:uncharacterized protein YggE
MTLLAGLLLIAALLSACGTAALAQTEEPADPDMPLRTLSVNGSGRTYITPDIAYISIGVHTEDANAAEAIAANTAQSQEVAQALRAFNIDPKDIQTNNFSVYPRQEYDQTGKPTELIFAVDNTVYVTLRDIDQVGDVIDGAVSAGANSITGIQFDVEDKSAALSQAREAAMANAQQQAQELAEAAGVTLGDIQTISSYNSYPMPYMDKAMGGGMAMEAAVASVPISPGQLSITVDVNVTYFIQ